MDPDPTPEDLPADPTLTVTDRVRPTRAGTAWPLLAVLALVGTLLVVVALQVDIDAIADPGWRDNALWAVGAALVLLGLGLAAVAWSVTSEEAGSTFPRVAVLAAVIGGIGAVVVLGLAGEQGGEIATSSASPVVTTTSGEAVPEPEPPLGLNEALIVENLTSVALPVTERTLVTLELTPPGNQLLAGAMGCRPQDLGNNTVLGTAIGGTWAQPLVVVGPPVKESGALVNRCHRVTVRLPLEAGVAVPRF